MKKINVQIKIIKSILLFLFFLIYTTLVSLVDLKPIGPTKTNVGFSTINQFFVEKIGVHAIFIKITDVLAIISFLVIAYFALLGLKQLITRKSIKKVDYQIIAMGFLYVALGVFYIIFEKIVINYRPVLIDDVLEASYPSSHTMLAVTVFGAAIFEIRRLFTERQTVAKFLTVLFSIIIVISVIGRLLSGIHWFTDIVGGVILSAFLVYTYKAAVDIIGFKKLSAENTIE